MCAAKFDAPAKAIEIEEIAKRSITELSDAQMLPLFLNASDSPQTKAGVLDGSARNLQKSIEDEKALAKALAPVWGDKDNMQALAAELQKISAGTFSSLPVVQVDFDQDKKTVLGLHFRGSAWTGVDRTNVTIGVKSSGQSIDLKLGREHDPEHTYSYSESLPQTPGKK